MGLLAESATSVQRLVPLDTIKYDNGIPGVQVGGSFYADQGSAPLQLLVLDRSDLSKVLNLGLGVNPPPDYFGPLAELLQQLPSTDLVIITHPGSTGSFPSDSLPSLNNALGKIGGTLPALWTFPAGGCWSGAANACSNPPNSDKWVNWQRGAFNGGSFTVIGVPRLKVGQAWRETAYQANSRDGRIAGYLTPGTATTGGTDYYTVINGGPAQDVPVDTCAGTSCAVRIGNQSYLPPGPNGLHVVELDRTTLAALANRTVTTAADLLSVITHSGIRFGSVGHFLSPPSMDDQRLIIIQSVGNGQVSGKATTPLVQYLDELGGTPDLLLGTLSGQRYALVGAATNLPWRNPSALESSAQVPVIPGSRRMQAGQISGALEVDRDGLYTPLAGDPVSATNTDLYRIIYQPAQPWPYAADTQELRYIANNIGLCQPQNQTCNNADVRSAYTDKNLASRWDTTYYRRLDMLGCPDPSACGPDFEAVRVELLKEFEWIPSVYDLGDNLDAPYVKAGSAPYFNVRKVVEVVQDEVKKSGPVPDSTPVTMQWLSIMSNVMNLASAVSAGLGGSAVYGLIASAGTLATSIMEQPGSDGGPADAVTTTAGKLADEMAQQQAAYGQWIDQMEGILLSDYGKLSAVGTAVGTDQWEWEAGVTTSKAVTALQADATASAYSALLPKVWPVYNLKPDGTNQQYSNNVTTLRCNPGSSSAPNYPFASALAQNQFRPPHGALTTINGDGGWVGQAWVFAKLNLNTWQNSYPNARTAQLPAESLTDKIYGPQSTGQYGAYQYEPVWWRDTYNPPGYTICTGATFENKPGYYSTAWSAPNIAPPLP
ncbi:MAG: hypothetical protein JO037_08235 [Actinobacteria bacterium]|nr:hypothetical protein [Actinomycetota bacterium]